MIQKMKLTKKQSTFLRNVIQEWNVQGIISLEQSVKFLESFEVLSFDWRRLAKYSLWIALISIIISVSAALSDKALLELVKKIFNAPDIIKCIFLGVIASGFYFWGTRRSRYKPQNRYSNEGLFFLGVLATAGSIFYLGVMFDNAKGHFSILLLVSFIIYGLLGVFLDSTLIWIFSILSLGSWFGTETGYHSGWGSYYLGMNYPLRFILFGFILTIASLSFLKIKKLENFYKSTFILGLLYLFISLWILSIFGNYGDFDAWEKVKQIELFHWSLLFGLASGVAIFYGLKYDNSISRGFGITFLLINLYTRFFEYFWDTLHKAIFFAILGIGFWYIGSKAEKIWYLGEKSSDGGIKGS